MDQKVEVNTSEKLRGMTFSWDDYGGNKGSFDIVEQQDDGGTSTSTSKSKTSGTGLSWPQRNYRCSFCKKEFKSAQALGGHMNVHRRDRAKMRLSSSSYSWDTLLLNNTNPNPSNIISITASSPPPAVFVPNLLPFVTSTTHDHHSYSCHSHLQLQCDHPHPVMKRRELRDVGMNLKKRGLVELRELEELPAVLTKGNDYSVVWMKKEEVVELDLDLDLSMGMGSVGEEKEDDDDDLDLELRLGL